MTSAGEEGHELMQVMTNRVQDEDDELATTGAVFVPPPLRTFRDLGIPVNTVVEIALKILYFNGTLRGGDLAQRLRIPFPVFEPVLKTMVDAGYCASEGIGRSGMAGATSVAEAVEWSLSSPGRQRVREVMSINQYAGPVPVPADVYAAIAASQMPEMRVSEEDLRNVLAHLTLPDRVLEALGPALNARHTVFLYGPPGVGKTSIAEACNALLGPPIFVPCALYTHGEIIRFFDPVYHTAFQEDAIPPHDERWVCVQRPEVRVGGELTPSALELSFDASLGFYDASAQLKANGGLFLIDDFGRQTRISTTELLNRLIVPLEKGVDYITVARAGTTIAVPFTTTLVISTNLSPAELMDEALLRRIRYKVHVPNPTEDEYKQIWRERCQRENVGYREDVIDALIHRHYRLRHMALRGVHPRDLLRHIISAAQYRGVTPELTHEQLEAACRTYFVQPDEPDDPLR